MLTIKTNNVPRPVVCGFELSERERADFDYLEGDALDSAQFVRYKGQTYDLGEFSFTGNMPKDNPLSQWQGVHNDSFFSGVCVKYCSDPEFVIVGTFYA